MDSYTRREAAWLLGLLHQEARGIDAMTASSWGQLRADVAGDLPVVVLCRDVHAAALRVARRAHAAGAGHDAGLTLVVLVLRGRGWTVRDIAAALELSAAGTQRRFDAGLRAVLDELGEPAAAAA